VWQALVDFEAMPEWFVGVRRVSLQAPCAEAGARRLLTLVTGATHQEHIGLWKPLEVFSIVVEDPPAFCAAWEGTIRVVRETRDVRVSWEMRTVPRWALLGVLIERGLLRPVVGCALAWSLRRLKRRLEAGAPEDRP
jgi:hypothetical protein